MSGTPRDANAEARRAAHHDARDLTELNPPWCKMTRMGEIENLQALLQDFADRRHWGQYHTPKNLAMAIAGEAGELAAEFQWLTPQESAAVMTNPTRGAAVRNEIADVAIYLLRLATILDIDLEDAVRAKVANNETRFPPDS
jgi:NTP pyrophosphatase (non-canonical NTP hydrolase)